MNKTITELYFLNQKLKIYKGRYLKAKLISNNIVEVIFLCADELATCHKECYLMNNLGNVLNNFFGRASD